MSESKVLKLFEGFECLKGDEERSKLISYVQKKVAEINPGYLWSADEKWSFSMVIGANAFRAIGFGKSELTILEEKSLKDIYQRGLSRIRGFQRYQRDGRKGKYFELSKDGVKALNKLSKAWNATNNLVIDTLLRDESLYEQKHREFMKDVRAKVAKRKNQFDELKADFASLREKFNGVVAERDALVLKLQRQSKDLRDARIVIQQLTEQLQNAVAAPTGGSTDSESVIDQNLHNDQTNHFETEMAAPVTKVPLKREAEITESDTSETGITPSNDKSLRLDVDRDQPFELSDVTYQSEPKREDNRPLRDKILSNASSMYSDKASKRRMRKKRSE